jgi:hypothetical protein
MIQNRMKLEQKQNLMTYHPVFKHKSTTHTHKQPKNHKTSHFKPIIEEK